MPRPASHTDRLELAAVAIGGAAGALARVALTRAFPVPVGGWPWVTFAINLAGAFMLGYLITHSHERPASALRRSLLGTGLCGAFTTFSTVQLELLQMLEHHRDGLALAYLTASVGGGLALVALASIVVRRRVRALA